MTEVVMAEVGIKVLRSVYTMYLGKYKTWLDLTDVDLRWLGELD